MFARTMDDRLSQRLRIVVATLLIAPMLALPRAIGQDTGNELPGAVNRFSDLERQIRNKSHDEYWLARERLSDQALRIAETDLGSKDAEHLLHWILKSERTTPAVLKAAKHLARHHATSDATFKKLLSYAQYPKQWTPELFAVYSTIDLSAEQRWLVDVYRAMHDKALLDLADEIKAVQPNGSFEAYESALGPALVTTLRESNTDALAAAVVDAFSRVSQQGGERMVAGIAVRELAEGAIFSMRHLRLGKKARGLDGKSIDDDTVALKNYQGKVVLIDFWATWCAPCVNEVPKQRQLVRKLDPSMFVLVGVSLDEDKTRLAEFLVKHEINWPVIFDSNRRLAARWQALSLPKYYVLDREHIVRYRGSDFHQAARIAESLSGNDESTAVAELVSMTLKVFDTNNDRRIERAELPDDKKPVLEAADLNKDGSLSIEELTKYVKENITATKAVPDNSP